MKNYEIYTHVEDIEKLKKLNLESIDGVYLGDPTCIEYPGNLANPKNITLLKEAVNYLKEKGKKAFLVSLAEPRNSDLKLLFEFIENLQGIDADGFEAHNMGAIRLIRNTLNIPIHVGFYANIYTHETVNLLSKYNAKVFYLNPELSLDEILFIKAHTNSEIAVFAHGKLPLGISEACFIKEELDKECSKCNSVILTAGKWKLKNVGKGTFSAKDWCTIEYLGTFLENGFRIFYINGLREDAIYINTLSEIYKNALEAINNGVKNYIKAEWIEKILLLSEYGVANGYLFKEAGYKYVGRCFYEEAINTSTGRKH